MMRSGVFFGFTFLDNRNNCYNLFVYGEILKQQQQKNIRHNYNIFQRYENKISLSDMLFVLQVFLESMPRDTKIKESIKILFI